MKPTGDPPTLEVPTLALDLPSTTQGILLSTSLAAPAPGSTHWDPQPLHTSALSSPITCLTTGQEENMIIPHFLEGKLIPSGAKQCP